MTGFPTVKTEIAFTPPGTGLVLNDTTLGKLDTGTLSVDPWVDVSAYVQHIDIARGSQRVAGPTIRYDTGACTIDLINTDGRFDPTNLSGPYVAAGLTQVTPMRGVRLTATYLGVTYPLFKGYADAWSTDYGANAITATVVASDGSKVLGNFNGPAQASTGAGEDSGARISRVLDNAGWPAADRSIQTGSSTVQATTLSSAAWDEILLTADSEFGQVYIDGAGKVTFQSRGDSITNPRSTTSQATFGDASGEYPYESVGLTYDDAQLANYARVARVGGTEQSAQDATSQSLYLKRTFVRTDLIVQTDGDALNYAGQIVYQWKDPELRIDHVDLHPSAVTSADMFPAVLGMAFGDRCTVRRRPSAQSGALVERAVLVRGVHHTITKKDWHASLVFQSASKWAFFTLNSATLGVLDANALTY